MNVRPLHDRLVVRRIAEGEQKSGAIIIPDTAKEKPQRGRVIAAGVGKVNRDGDRSPLDVKAGDSPRCQRPVGGRMIAQVGTISANHDEAIGQIIAGPGVTL
jgi:co-chaperonin GroES (HSP10)